MNHDFSVHELSRLDGAVEYLDKNGFHEPALTVTRLRSLLAAKDRLLAEQAAVIERYATIIESTLGKSYLEIPAPKPEPEKLEPDCQHLEWSDIEGFDPAHEKCSQCGTCRRKL